MVIHVIWLRGSNRERCLRFLRSGQKKSGSFLSKYSPLCCPLQSYPSSRSACATIKNQLKDLYLYGSNTKLDLLSFQFVLFLKRNNKTYKEMCFEAASQVSVYRIPASWGSTFGLGITGRMAVKSFPIDFCRVPHCVLMAPAEDSPKGQKHFFRCFWISKAWFGLSRNVLTENTLVYSHLEKCTPILPNFNRGTEVIIIQVKVIATVLGFYPKQQD